MCVPLRVYGADNTHHPPRANARAQPSEVLFIELVRGEGSDSSIQAKRIVRDGAGEPMMPSIDDAELLYGDMDREVANADLQRRLEHYRKVYEPLALDEPTKPNTPMMIRLCSDEMKLTIRGVRSFVAQRIASLLMNIRTRKKKIWFSRHGER